MLKYKYELKNNYLEDFIILGMETRGRTPQR